MSDTNVSKELLLSLPTLCSVLELVLAVKGLGLGSIELQVELPKYPYNNLL